jgi:altronate dehydratase
MGNATALKINARDNVATVLKEIEKGEAVVYFDDGKQRSLTAKESIPAYHKISLLPLRQDGLVYKYGEIIGKVTQDVDTGCWISDRNLLSLPRNYEHELEI